MSQHEFSSFQKFFDLLPPLFKSLHDTENSTWYHRILDVENVYPFISPFLHSTIFLIAPTVGWVLFRILGLQNFSPETWKRGSAKWRVGWHIFWVCIPLTTNNKICSHPWSCVSISLNPTGCIWFACSNFFYYFNVIKYLTWDLPS